MRPRRESTSLWCLALATLLISCSLRPVLSSPGSTNSRELEAKQQANEQDNAEQMKVEARSKELEAEAQSISEISLNVESSLKLKKSDKLTLGKSVTAASPPALSPRNRVLPTQRRSSHISKASSKDSYLDALEHSHTMQAARDELEANSKPKIARREYSPGPVYRAEDSSSSSSSGSNKIAEAEAAKISRISYQGNKPGIVSAPVYIAPSDNSYSQPQISFGGADYNSYDSPYAPAAQTSYGPAPNAYGPPPPASFHPPGHPYGPSPQQGLGSIQATYSTSHPLPDLWPLAFLPPLDFSWPISLKLNTYTLIKIILKLIVFKMIVKFIAVICLLLFIPKIIEHKPEHSDDEDESRQFSDKPNFSSERLRLLTSIVSRSIEHYEDMRKNGSARAEPKPAACTGLGCQLGRSWLASTDTWHDYIRLFKSYVAEEQAAQQQLAANKQNGSRRRRRRRR